MRMTHYLLALGFLISPLVLSSAPAAAQQSPVPSVCKGNLNIVRVSEIKPGMMDKFLEAVAAQKAWYKKAGLPDEIGLMRVLNLDATTKADSFSTTEAITTHIEPASRTGATPHDAGFDAFVALFKDSSTIKTQYVTCMTR